MVASDAFDDFVADVQPFLQHLPVVESEIGDTWIMGASSDPVKVARYRAASRARAACAAEGRCSSIDEPNIRAFDRLLLKISEHTWGWNGGDLRTPAQPGTAIPVMDGPAVGGTCKDNELPGTTCMHSAFRRTNESTADACCAQCATDKLCRVWEWQSTASGSPNKGNCHLKKAAGTIAKQTGTVCGSKGKFPPTPSPIFAGNYSNAYLQHMLHNDLEYQNGVRTWTEQRSFVSNAVAALSANGVESQLQAAIRDEFAKLQPTSFNTNGFQLATNVSEVFHCGDLKIGFGRDGSIATLVGPTGHAWANGGQSSIAKLWYEGVSHAEEVAYLSEYIRKPTYKCVVELPMHALLRSRSISLTLVADGKTLTSQG